MRKIVKVLSHRDRVSGRILSGGSQVAKNKDGDILVKGIESGFFEKRMIKNNTVVPCLFIPQDLLYAITATNCN